MTAARDQLVDADTLPLPFGGLGLTDAPEAVFGIGALRSIPAWVFDPAAVDLRLNAKVDGDPEVWAALADVLAAIQLLPCDAPLNAQQWDLLYPLVVLVEALVENLPDVPPRMVALPAQLSPGDADVAGPFRGWLDSLAADVADLLAEPGWVDPDVLAGLVADLYDALLDYAAAASGWHQINQRRRTTRTRRTSRCARRSGGTGVSAATSP